jgi:hypothetical protein
MLLDNARAVVPIAARFSVDLSRSLGLLDEKCLPANLAGVVTHLHFAEPGNFVVARLIESGALHKTIDEVRRAADAGRLPALPWVFGSALAEFDVAGPPPLRSKDVTPVERATDNALLAALSFALLPEATARIPVPARAVVGEERPADGEASGDDELDVDEPKNLSLADQPPAVGAALENYDAGARALIVVQRSGALPFDAPLPGAASATWIDALTGAPTPVDPTRTVLAAAPWSIRVLLPKGDPCLP